MLLRLTEYAGAEQSKAGGQHEGVSRSGMQAYGKLLISQGEPRSFPTANYPAVFMSERVAAGRAGSLCYLAGERSTLHGAGGRIQVLLRGRVELLVDGW